MSENNTLVAKWARVGIRFYGQSIVNIGLLIAFGGVITALGIWVYQIYGWLRFAEWVPFPLYRALPSSIVNGLAEILLEWQGLAKIVDWYLSLNVGVCMLPVLFIGNAIGAIGLSIREPADEKIKRAERSALGYDD